MAHVEALLVQSDSDCPSAEAVQAEVRELTTAEQRRAVPPGARAVVSDRGDSISIAVTRDGKTTLRVYRDAARDCARRGHFVSVLVVVSLMPPELGSDPETSASPGAPATPGSPAPSPEPGAGPPGEPEASPVRAPAAPSMPASSAEPPDDRASRGPALPRRVRIELGGRAEAGTPISDSVRVAQWGASLGVALGTGEARWTLGIDYFPKTELRYTGDFAGRARLERLGAALGAQLELGHVPLDTSFDAGLVLTRAVVWGLDSQRPARATALVPGARAGFHVTWSELGRLGPFAAAHADVFPFAPALTELPQGTVGHLPYVWVGLSAGLALAL